MLQTLLSAFKLRHNAAKPASPAPTLVVDSRSADKERFANAKRRMVRELWEMGFPRAEIISAVGFYAEGRAEALERCLADERHAMPHWLLYNYAAQDPFHGCHAFAKWEIHRLQKECSRWSLNYFPMDDCTPGKAHHLRKWGITEEEIIKWANETRRRNEDRELAQALEK